MTLWRLIRRSLQHHWRMHVAVMLGVAIATAVLTGALIVGDSVRGSLRYLALDRLQNVDLALVGDRYFRLVVASELAAQPEFSRHFSRAVAASLLPNVTVEPMQDGSTVSPTLRRSGDVLLVGSDDGFWSLRGAADANSPQRLPGDDEIVLNQPLANELGVDVGDRVVIRLPTANQVPADSPLGHKENRVRSVADLEIINILPATGLGRFRLRSSQQQPHNAYVSLETINRALDQNGKANALLVSTNESTDAGDPALPHALRKLLNLDLGDYGISLERVRREFGSEEASQTVADFFQITQDRLVLDDETASAVRTALKPHNPRELFTYLATSIERPGSNTDEASSIPYSTITAVDAETARELLRATNDDTEKLGDDEILLNSWAANNLGVRIGDRIVVRYFEPETTHDQPSEEQAEFRLKAIIPLTEPTVGYRRRRPAVFDSRPTVANDPEMTPRVEGVTDEESIANWDPPFPFDQSRVRTADDTYWQNHRTTPKAFISLAVGQKLWGSRFGHTTSFRVLTPPDAEDPTTFGDEIRSNIASQLREVEGSFVFTPVKARALTASSGTTPFEFLFLGFSMFLIASALMLVVLLFRLGLEVRANEFGILRAVGFGVQRLKKETLLETSVVAVVGAMVGAAMGVAYAWLMLAGLRTWWLDAIVTPFLELHFTPLSVLAGFLLGTLSGLAVVWASLRRLRNVPPRQLLHGTLTSPSPTDHKSAIRSNKTWLIVLLMVCAVGAAIAGIRLRGEAQAGAFFGCGALVLTAALLATMSWLRNLGHHRNSQSRLGLLSLSARAATRRPTRSALTTSLMAAACFLIIAISAFRLAPSSAGTGGFDWLLESGRPIHLDFGNAAARQRSFGPDAEKLTDVTILPLRVQEGDDASCRNLYRAARPRILGVSRQMIDYFDNHEGFVWSDSAAESDQQRANPWRLLRAGESWESNLRKLDTPMPVVLDKNTAMYSLRLYGGVGEEFTLDYERVGPVRFRVVGLVSNSILQGNLLVAEEELLARFRNVNGYRMFLAKTPSAPDEVAHLLEATFGDVGLDAKRTTTVLADLMAVQNTYLSTFQSLGALGLLLGVVGLAIAQTRNVLERRGEFALLQSVGFRRVRIGQLVLAENGVLMLLGLGIGVFAALITVLPHLVVGGAQIPWRSLGLSLLAVLAAGLIASLITVRAAAAAPLIAALRGD